MNPDEISNMSGDSQFKKPKEMKLNQIALNGKEGFFTERMLLEEKSENGKYAKRNLGKELKVVFLKHRRTLASMTKNAGQLEIMQTNEHNHKDDQVFLFGPNEKGRASDLREKYPKLKTNQIVYAWVPELEEIVRINIKGSSLGSNNKAKEVMGYYDYLTSFASDEYSWQYYTILKPIEESNDMGSYFAIEFTKGEKIEPEEVDKVVAMIKEIHSFTSAYDSFYAKRNATEIKKSETKEELPSIEYPEDEINSEDVPF